MTLTCRILSDLWSFDEALNAWTELVATQPPRRYDHSTTMLQDGRMVVIGGNCPDVEGLT